MGDYVCVGGQRGVWQKVRGTEKEGHQLESFPF